MTATNITLSSLVKSAGDDYKMNDIEKMFTFLVTENYIAFSRQVPVEVVNVWQQTLEDIKSEGLLIEIQKKWLQ